MTHPLDGVQFGVLPPEQFLSMPGLELLQRMLNKELPAPQICQTLNYWPVEIGEGHVAFEGEPDQRLFNPMGLIHGGYVLTMIDTVTACAAHSTLPVGVGYTTIETKANMTRPVTLETGRLRAEGKVVSQGRQIITADAFVYDSRRRLMAHGASTLMVLRPDRPQTDRPPQD